MERPRDALGRFLPYSNRTPKSNAKKRGRKLSKPKEMAPNVYLERRRPSMYISPPKSVSCSTWSGCVYSSMASDARMRGMKLKHGIDDLHKLLHTAKREYPSIYKALPKDPNAWLKNPELATRVRKLYVPRASAR